MGTFSLQSQNATISGSSVNIDRVKDFDLQQSTLRLQSAAGGKLALGGDSYLLTYQVTEYS